MGLRTYLGLKPPCGDRFPRRPGETHGSVPPAKQAASTETPAARISSRLNDLQPEVPWAHYFNFGHGIETITPSNAIFYAKSRTLLKFPELVIAAVTERWGGMDGLRILDLASAEGGHSVAYAKAGAREVVGVEGRALYVERARFVAETLEVPNVQFRQGDVRNLSVRDLGTFDVVVCCGILYHIDTAHFHSVIRSLYDLSTKGAVISSQVATPWAREHFSLGDAAETAEGYEGFLFKEHSEEDSAETRLARVRSSLDNATAFWPTPAALFRAVKEAGFVHINHSVWPSLFDDFNLIEGRPLLVASKI